MNDREQALASQFEAEADRYLRHNGIDVDRYGMGKNVVKLLMSVLAMHAMNHVMSRQSQASPQKPKPAQQSSPSNQDFEKLHPRAQTPGSGQKPGQFTAKPEGQKQQAPAPKPREARPLTERPDKKPQLSQSPPTQQQQQEQQAPVTPKPWLAEPGTPKPDVTEYDRDPRRGTPEQKAARMEQMKARDAGSQKPPVQTPKDANTARIAEIWDVDATTPSAQTFDVWHSPKTGSSKPSGAATAGLGDVFATDNKEYAAQYGTPGEYTATMQNPYQMSSAEFRSLDRGFDASFQKSAQFRKQLESKGHDGIVVSHADGTKEHVLFNKDNLKPKAPQVHTVESFTADVLGKLKTQPAGPNPRKKFLQDGSVNPDFNPQDLGVKKIAKPSLLDMPAQSGDGDIFANPAAKARKEKAELDRITQFDPSMFTEQEQPEAPSAPVTINDVGGDYVALEQARKDRQKLVTANRNWEIETQEDPEANTAEIASEYELDHEPFSKYVNEMQSFEQGEWKRREKVKSAIRKAWNVNSQDLSDMENRKGLDHSSLQGADQLKGSLDDSDIYEFLGADEQDWAQNAWEMLREDPPPKPGAHSKDWLRTHAEQFTRLHQMSGQSQQDYPEPEDGMPFSKRSLFDMVDRYFKQEQLRFHGRRPQSSSSFWTALDSWL